MTAWEGNELIGFGRATSDGVFRGVLWDIVVRGDAQGRGVGKAIIRELTKTPALINVQRVYIMTTNSSGFYEKVGFTKVAKQQLMVLVG